MSTLSGGSRQLWRLPSATATLVVVGNAEQRRAGDAQPRRARLNQRFRQAFVEGAEEGSRRRLGRGLTAEELERVLRRYPGDIGTLTVPRAVRVDVLEPRVLFLVGDGEGCAAMRARGGR